MLPRGEIFGELGILMAKKNAVGWCSASNNGRSIARSFLTSSPPRRAREPISRSFGLVRGKFPSLKMGRMIHWESQLERDAVYLFEFSPGVAAFREQPLTTYYTLDGKTRRYTPDFEIISRAGEAVLIEIKPAAKLLDPDESDRFRRIEEHFASHGRAFRILTDREIRQPVLLENLRLLMRNRRAPASPFERRCIIELFAGKPAISFANAAAPLGGVHAVWRLIGEGILSCDLSQHVNEQTVLCVVATGELNEKLFF